MGGFEESKQIQMAQNEKGEKQNLRNGGERESEKNVERG